MKLRHREVSATELALSSMHKSMELIFCINALQVDVSDKRHCRTTVTARSGINFKLSLFVFPNHAFINASDENISFFLSIFLAIRKAAMTVKTVDATSLIIFCGLRRNGRVLHFKAASSESRSVWWRMKGFAISTVMREIWFCGLLQLHLGSTHQCNTIIYIAWVL